MIKKVLWFCLIASVSWGQVQPPSPLAAAITATGWTSDGTTTTTVQNVSIGAAGSSKSLKLVGPADTVTCQALGAGTATYYCDRVMGSNSGVRIGPLGVPFLEVSGVATYPGGFSTVVASGSNAFAALTNGARIDVGAGANDYFYSDGTTITTPGQMWITSGSGIYLNAAGSRRIYDNGTNLEINSSLTLAGTTDIRLSSGGAYYMNGLTGTAFLFFDGTDVKLGTPTGLTITGDTTTPARAALRLIPQDAEPTGPNVVGDVYVTSAGLLKICTVAGSPGTFVSVGAQ